MNYLSFGGLLFLRYAYVDLNVNSGYVADSLFYKRKIPVWVLDEAAKGGEKYRIIRCRILRKDKRQFEAALAEIPTKMSLLGHNDYDDYCDQLTKRINKDKETNHHERKQRL